MIYIVLGLLSTISIVDIKRLYIPDSLLIALALLALINGGDWGAMFLSAVVLGGLGVLLRQAYVVKDKLPALGLGDCKMLFVCGLWLQPTMIPAFLIIAGLCGVITGIVWYYLDYGDRFPFAPSISLALLQSLSQYSF